MNNGRQEPSKRKTNSINDDIFSASQHQSQKKQHSTNTYDKSGGSLDNDITKKKLGDEPQSDDDSVEESNKSGQMPKMRLLDRSQLMDMMLFP